MLDMHAMVNSKDFKIIETENKHTYNGKIAEALYIKRDKPSLNVQTMSVPFLIVVTIITLIDRAFMSLIVLNQHHQTILC